MCFPHELLGYDQDDYAGILLSIEIATELHKEQQAYEKSNKSKANSRQQKAPRRNTTGGKKANPRSDRPTKG